MKPGASWQMVEEKLVQIKAMADAAWKKGDWDKAVRLFARILRRI